MRPKPWHHVMTGLSAAVLLGVTLFVAIRYGALPEQIPTHFGPGGQADSFGPKSGIFFPLVMGWFLLALITVLSFFPETWNVPRKSPRTLAAAADMIAVLRLVMALMFAWMTLCSALGRGLGGWFLPVSMIGVFAPLAYLIVESLRP